jgi:hypothetical protein
MEYKIIIKLKYFKNYHYLFILWNFKRLKKLKEWKIFIGSKLYKRSLYYFSYNKYEYVINNFKEVFK